MRLINRWPAAAMALSALCFAANLQAQDRSPEQDYHDNAALSSALRDVANRHGNVAQVFEIARSPGGTAIEALRLGAGEDVESRPALLVVAGAYGPHLIGSEVALNAARELAASYGGDSATTALLDRFTVYLVPRVNPDGADAFFETPRRERIRNEQPYDDDRDTEVDEDGPEDLDGNGLITQMRVLDPTGEWMPDPDDPELLRKADAAKGEAGVYRLYVEGIDNDGDERWNEDPPGGTNVNRNLPYGFEFFTEAAGLHPVSAPEARAIAQFYLDHPNVAVVYALGPQDNLIEAWEHDRRDRTGGSEADVPSWRRNRQPLTSILQADEPYFAEVADRFQEITGLTSGPESAPSSGDVLASAYYDMGRWAFGSRVWWVPKDAPDEGEAREEPGADAPDEGRESAGGEEEPEAEPAPETEADGSMRSAGRGTKEEKDPLEDDRRALHWFEEHAPGSFVEWTEVRHPDFPDRTVEVGGFAPFARLNPPASEIDSVLARQQRFIVALANMLPSIALRNVEVVELSSGVYRVEAQLVNEGYFPTLSALGERARWPRRIRVEVEMNGQEIAAGDAVRLVGPVAGNGGHEDLHWVVTGDPGSRITLRASSPVAGEASQTVTLR